MSFLDELLHEKGCTHLPRHLWRKQGFHLPAGRRANSNTIPAPRQHPVRQWIFLAQATMEDFRVRALVFLHYDPGMHSFVRAKRERETGGIQESKA